MAPLFYRPLLRLGSRLPTPESRFRGFLSVPNLAPSRKGQLLWAVFINLFYWLLLRLWLPLKGMAPGSGSPTLIHTNNNFLRDTINIQYYIICIPHSLVIVYIPKYILLSTINTQMNLLFYYICRISNKFMHNFRIKYSWW